MQHGPTPTNEHHRAASRPLGPAAPSPQDGGRFSTRTHTELGYGYLNGVLVWSSPDGGLFQQRESGEWVRLAESVTRALRCAQWRPPKLNAQISAKKATTIRRQRDAVQAPSVSVITSNAPPAVNGLEAIREALYRERDRVRELEAENKTLHDMLRRKAAMEAA